MGAGGSGDRRTVHGVRICYHAVRYQGRGVNVMGNGAHSLSCAGRVFNAVCLLKLHPPFFCFAGGSFCHIHSFIVCCVHRTDSTFVAPPHE